MKYRHGSRVGSLSVIQGAATGSTYSALVLGRDLAQQPEISVTSPVGSSHARIRLEPAPVAQRLRAQLDARRLRALYLRADGLTAGAPYGFTLDDRHGATTSFTTSTLPAELPTSGACLAVATCFFSGFSMATRLRAALSNARLVTQPIAELWAGDNLYLDVRDFDHANPAHAHQQTFERYLQYFTSPDYVAARGARPTFTAYDDHEFWNNYPERQLWLKRSWDANFAGYSDAAQDCLSLFQSGINPSPLVPGGRAYRFDLKPVSFFVADLRSQRQRQDSGRFRMMDPRELQELLSWAMNLKGPGVLVVGQPLWTSAGGSTDYNPPAFTAEYQAIWRALRDAPWDILVVSGDVHHSRLLRLGVGGDRFVYELVTSPVSHIPTLWATVGVGNSQDRGEVAPPQRADNLGFAASAEYFFGTSVANTFALLRLVPRPGGQVGVGAAFVDYGGNAPAYPLSEPVNLPRLGLQGKPCVAEELFTLRRR